MIIPLFNIVWLILILKISFLESRNIIDWSRGSFEAFKISQNFEEGQREELVLRNLLCIFFLFFIYTYYLFNIQIIKIMYIH